MLSRDWLEGYFYLYNPERHVPVNLIAHKTAILDRVLRRVTEDGKVIKQVGRWCPHGRRYRII